MQRGPPRLLADDAPVAEAEAVARLLSHDGAWLTSRFCCRMRRGGRRGPPADFPSGRTGRRRARRAGGRRRRPRRPAPARRRGSCPPARLGPLHAGQPQRLQRPRHHCRPRPAQGSDHAGGKAATGRPGEDRHPQQGDPRRVRPAQRLRLRRRRRALHGSPAVRQQPVAPSPQLAHRPVLPPQRLPDRPPGSRPTRTAITEHATPTADAPDPARPRPAVSTRCQGGGSTYRRSTSRPRNRSEGGVLERFRRSPPASAQSNATDPAPRTAGDTG